MKKLLVIVLTLISLLTYSQNNLRLPVWTFHDDSSSIVGLSLGLNASIPDFKNVKVYGVNFELLGLGVIVPLIPSSPFANDTLMENDSIKPSYKIVINGLSVSPLGLVSECKVNGVSVNGIGNIIDVNNGFSIAALMNLVGLTNGIQVASISLSHIMNGAQISIWHNVVEKKMNGIQICLIGNWAETANGVQISIANFSKKHSGIQIGIYNKTEQLSGLQIGLWNVNAKRKLPLLNW